VPDGLYIGLFHGFKNEEAREAKGDWGEQGALIGPLKYYHTTYASTFRIEFMEGTHHEKYGYCGGVDIEIVVEGGCVQFDGMQYGDWTVFYIKDGEAIGNTPDRILNEPEDNTEVCDCGRAKKSFMHNCSGTSTMNEVYGCPKCDDKCGFCNNDVKTEMKFRNFYRHIEGDCNEEWDDVWDSTCNDKCPKCNKEIEPYKSEDVETGEEV
jgi:hypothetical protein